MRDQHPQHVHFYQCNLIKLLRGFLLPCHHLLLLDRRLLLFHHPLLLFRLLLRHAHYRHWTLLILITQLLPPLYPLLFLLLNQSRLQRLRRRILVRIRRLLRIQCHCLNQHRIQLRHQNQQRCLSLSQHQELLQFQDLLPLIQQ